MDAPFADLLYLLLAVATVAGLAAQALVFEKVTAESATTARITDPSSTPGTTPGTTGSTPGTPTTPDSSGEARA